MRSYGQFCPLARALDVIGDRWTLLIIRELMARDCRYSDLRHGMPGIATNLLADRLRHLEDHGVIDSYEAPRPVGATVYRLTPRGRDLIPAVQELARWGVPFLADTEAEHLRTHTVRLGLPLLFEGIDTRDLEPFTAVIRSTGDEPVTIRLTRDGVTVEPGAVPEADVLVEGPPAALAALVQRDDFTDVTMSGSPEAALSLRTLAHRALLGHRDPA